MLWEKPFPTRSINWGKLVGFLEHPQLPVDNNYLENQIEPFSTGRRAWLFVQTQHGARASANLYSLVSCARVNGLEPHAYLLHLFEELPQASTAEALEALLPWNDASNGIDLNFYPVVLKQYPELNPLKDQE